MMYPCRSFLLFLPLSYKETPNGRKSKYRGLLSENNYRYLMRFDGNEQAIRQNLHLLQVSHGQPYNKLCEELKNSGYLSKETSLLDPTVGYMLGVAVGTREIKVSLVDFAFQSVPRRKLRALELGSLLDHDLLHTQNELENSETENYLCLNSSQDLEH